MRRVMSRLLPLMALMFLVNQLDRVNVSFAALTMNRDIGLDALSYAWGAGIFFIAYFVFEVPSNLVMERVGARRWIGRIMISWGLVSAAFAFTRGPMSFFILRFSLGLAEAGFFPGMILYLTYWFPTRERARRTALFMSAIPIAGVIGSPLSGFILSAFDGFAGKALGDEASKAVQVNEVGEFEAVTESSTGGENRIPQAQRANFYAEVNGASGAHFVQKNSMKPLRRTVLNGG